MATDPKAIRVIQDWLNSPDKNVPEGAELLLRINRNRMMYQYILRKRDVGKLSYELRKHLKILLDGMTRRDVVVLEHKVLPRVKATLAAPAPVKAADVKYKGRRKDHDSLPAEIKALYDSNGETFFKLKSVWNTLMQMMDSEPCDRYEQLKILDELDCQYRANLEKYDHYDINSKPAAPAAITPKQVNAARKYLSDNKKKLGTLKDETKKKALLQKMQERVTLLVKAGETFDSSQQKDLTNLGLMFSS